MNGGRPRVFISHSTCGDVQCGCERARTLLEGQLKSAGCVPILDVRLLQPGEQWHRRLIRELFTCDACVVLVSRHALESNFVLEEAILARVLHEYTAGTFAVLPVLLDGVTRASLGVSKLQSARLTDLQLSAWSSGPDLMSPPRDLEDAIHALASHRCRFPEPLVHEVVAAYLFQAYPAALRDAAELLHLPNANWLDHLHETVALDLLRERLVEQRHDPLRLALKRLLPTVPTAGRPEVIERVVPFARIPTEAADQLRGVAARQSRRTAVLAAHQRDTPRLYLRRASANYHTWTNVEPTPGSGVNFTDGLIAEIREFLVDLLAYGVACEDAELDDLLQRHEREEGPVTVIIRQQIDHELRDSLVDVFPRVLFLYVSDDSPDDGTTQLRRLSLVQEVALARTYTEMLSRYT
jgi:TIR domain